MSAPHRRFLVAVLNAIKPGKASPHPMSRLRDAAANGDPEAQYRIGEAYLAGRQPAAGEHWLRLAAEQGHARARHSLSLLYMSGARAQGDAASWLKEAQARAISAANAALLFPKGLDVAPDPEKGFALAEAAARQGLACAQAHLGLLYLRGIGCRQDFAKAQEWCRRAADQREAAGALGLGILHEHGFGMARDPKEAARWYALAADLGNDAAATALGLLHLDGLGVDRDIAKARRLLAGPASRGHGLAKRGLAELHAMTVTAQSEIGRGEVAVKNNERKMVM